jgi:hypothetical protein
MIEVRALCILGIKPLLELLNDYFGSYAFREYVGQSRIGMGICLYNFGCGSILTMY